MVTRLDAKKLGLQYVDLSQEKNNIAFLSSLLGGQLNSLEQSTLKLTTPPVDTYSPGSQGDIAFDNEYVYICTETNVWKRAKLNELQ